MSTQCDIIDLLRNEGKIAEAAAVEIVRLRSKLAAAEAKLAECQRDAADLAARHVYQAMWNRTNKMRDVIIAEAINAATGEVCFDNKSDGESTLDYDAAEYHRLVGKYGDAMSAKGGAE